MKKPKTLIRTLAVVLTQCLILNGLALDSQPNLEGVSHLAAPSAFDRPLAQEVSSRALLSKAAAKISSLIPSLDFSQGILASLAVTAAAGYTSAFENHKFWVLGFLALNEVGLFILSKIQNKKDQAQKDEKEKELQSRWEKSFFFACWFMISLFVSPVVMDYVSEELFKGSLYSGVILVWGIGIGITMIALRRLFLFATQLLDFCLFVLATLYAKIKRSAERPAFHSEKRMAFAKRGGLLVALLLTTVLSVFTFSSTHNSLFSMHQGLLNHLGLESKYTELQKKWWNYIGIKEEQGNILFSYVDNWYDSRNYLVTKIAYPYDQWLLFKAGEKEDLTKPVNEAHRLFLFTLNAADILGRKKIKGALPTIRELLKKDRLSYDRYSFWQIAFTFLEEMPDPDSVPRLIELSNEDSLLLRVQEHYMRALSRNYSVASATQKEKILEIIVKFSSEAKTNSTISNLRKAVSANKVDPIYIVAAKRLGVEGIGDLMVKLKDDEEAVEDLCEWIVQEEAENVEQVEAAIKVLQNISPRLGDKWKQMPHPAVQKALTELGSKGALVSRAQSWQRMTQPNGSWLLKLMSLFQSLFVVRLALDLKKKISRRPPMRNPNVKTPQEMAEIVKAAMAKYGTEPVRRELSEGLADLEADSYPRSLRLAEGNELLFMLDDEIALLERRAAYDLRARQILLRRYSILPRPPRNVDQYIGWYLEYYLKYRTDPLEFGEEDILDLASAVTPEQIREYIVRHLRDPELHHLQLEFLFGEMIRRLKLRDGVERIDATNLVNLIEDWETIPALRGEVSPLPSYSLARAFYNMLAYFRPQSPDIEKSVRLQGLIEFHFGTLQFTNLVRDIVFTSNIKKLYLRGIRFPEGYVEIFDLSQADLREADFENRRVERVNLGEANLQRANFRNAVIRGINMVRADLRWADFTDAQFGSDNAVSHLMQQLQSAGRADAGHVQRAREVDEESNRNDLRSADLRWAIFNSKVVNVIVGADPETGRKTRILRKDKEAYFSDFSDELFQIEEDIPSPISAEEAVATAL